MSTTDLSSHAPWLESQRRSRARRFVARDREILAHVALVIGNASTKSFKAAAQLRAFARRSVAIARERAESQQQRYQQRDDDDETRCDQNDLVHDFRV